MGKVKHYFGVLEH